MEFLGMIQLGAASLFTFNSMVLLIVGIVIGLIAGSIPGLSASNTTAILLPTTLGMSMEGGLVFIAAIYVGCQYGGSIPAILLKTPGAVGNVATGIDGHPLARMGRADYALGISLTASSFGGTLAGIISILIIIPISRIALNFGPAEIFLLALLGIAIIVGISDRSPSMGLLAGLVGILIGTMPADTTLGQPRLTFGLLELYDEFPAITAMIGLFAFGSLIALVDDASTEHKRQKVGQFSQIWAGTKRVFKSPFLLVFSTIIGLFIGVIPGAGVDIAALMAYSQAKIWSKKPEEFGKGAPDGIIAPEAANNAVVGGAMVPTMTLGVPGSGTAAVMLAALIMHGVRPGPQVMREYPGQIYAMLLAVVVASSIQWGFGYFYTKFAVRLAGTRNQFLIPAVLATCIIGSFATRQFILDVWIFIIFGIIGYILVGSGFPYVSLVLGIVMGALAEGYYIIAISISRGSYSIFFRSVYSWIMWLVIFAVLIVPIVSNILKKQKAKTVTSSSSV
jgi:putative tricarboxylic transport membrane protein